MRLQVSVTTVGGRAYTGVRSEPVTSKEYDDLEKLITDILKEDSGYFNPGTDDGFIAFPLSQIESITVRTIEP